MVPHHSKHFMLGAVDNMYFDALKRKDAKMSPLLRLPPELRNKIYEYVLGGWEIHLAYKYDTGRQRRTFCRPLQDPPARSDSVDVSQSVGGLMRTCRLLYAETRLLPFMLNAIAFTKIWHAPKHRFNLLLSEQRDLIHTIRIISGFSHSDYTDLLTYFEEGLSEMLPVLRGLIGLKHVVVVWEKERTYEDCGWEWFQRMMAKKVQDALWNVEVKVVRPEPRKRRPYFDDWFPW